MTPDSQRIRVLCVDDSPTARAAVIIALASKVHFAAVAESDPLAAIEMARRAAQSDRPFHLFVFDIDMQPMNGLALLDAMRKIPHYRKTPVAFLTGTKDEAKIEAALSQGASLIPKFRVAALRSELEALMRGLGLWPKEEA